MNHPADEHKTQAELIDELTLLRQQLVELKQNSDHSQQVSKDRDTYGEFFHLLVQNMPQNIFSKNLEGQFTFANQQYCRTEGKELADILGKTDFDMHPPEAAQKYRADDQRVMQTGEPINVVEEHQPLEGEKLYVQVIKTPIYDSHGKVIGILGAFWDVTDLKRAEDGLRKINEELDLRVKERTERLEIERENAIRSSREAELARERAEIANHAKSEFLSNMSHELRTPLNGILGYAQILKRRRDIPAYAIDGLNIIQQSGNHLLTLINDILDLSKIEARKMEIYPAEVNLPSFLEGVVGIMRMKGQEKDLLFGYEVNDIPTGVMADEKRLRQVLLNLLGNAIKFTHEGQVTLRVSHLQTDGQKRISLLRFEVVDTGVGMLAEDVVKIFEAFEQVGDVKKRAEGTGLGLAITKQLVELMGGELQVYSELGQGTTFWFELRLPVILLASTVHQDGEAQRIIGYEGPPCRLLIVDDIVSNRQVLQSLLEPLGFELQQAENGAIALDIAQRWRPHIILTDLVMPVMGGVPMIKAIQENPALAETKIIVLSASSFDKKQWQEASQISDAFLNKPFNVAELFAAMADSLGLTWRYDEEVSTTQAAEVIPLEMVIPPREALEQLHEFAHLGSMKRIRAWAKQIIKQDEQYQPFADEVLALAKNFEAKMIEALVERYISSPLPKP